MINFGLTTDDFHARVFERAPHLQRSAVQAPMQWQEVNELLHDIEPTDAGLQLFQDGQGLIAQGLYTDDAVVMGQRRRRLIKRRFYGHLRNGATLVLNRLENHALFARRLCAEVARFSGNSASSNGYISFGGNGSFGPHWDTHDVFALQLIGRKRWQLFAPTFPLPLSQHTSQSQQTPCPSVATLDVVLEPGDLLYIPRGWWHRVHPFDSGSFHLSVGTYGPSVLDLVQWAARQYLPAQLAARRSVASDAAGLADIASALDQLKLALLNPASIHAFQRDLAERERGVSEFDLALFAERTGPASLAATAMLSLGACLLSADKREVSINGARLRLDDVSRAVVSRLATGEVSLGDLVRQLALPPAALMQAVMEMATHDVVIIRR